MLAFGPNKLCRVENVEISYHLGSQFSASLSGSKIQASVHQSFPEWKKMQPPPLVFTTFKLTGDQSNCESLTAASRTFTGFYKLILLKQPTQGHIRTEVQLCEGTKEL